MLNCVKEQTFFYSEEKTINVLCSAFLRMKKFGHQRFSLIDASDQKKKKKKDSFALNPKTVKTVSGLIHVEF